jgi:hypothetical protein
MQTRRRDGSTESIESTDYTEKDFSEFTLSMASVVRRPGSALGIPNSPPDRPNIVAVAGSGITEDTESTGYTEKDFNEFTVSAASVVQQPLHLINQTSS